MMNFFLKFLQKSFDATTFVPFFGALMSTFALVIIALIFLMYSTVVFISEYNDKEFSFGTQEINHQCVQLEKPVVI